MKKFYTPSLKKYEEALDFVQEALQDLNAVPGETASSLAERIEQILKRKFGEEEE